MERFRLLLRVFLDHRNTLGCGLATVLTVATESLFSNVVFKCPCDGSWNQRYSLVFLLVPALLLAVLDYLVRTRTWCLVAHARCCCCRCRCCSGSTECGQHPGARWQLCCTMISLPLTWVSIALLEGTYYVCAASGSSFLARRFCSDNSTDANEIQNCMSQMPLVPCGKAELPKMERFPDVLKAQSQVYGWILIGAVTLCLMICSIIYQKSSPVGFQHLKFGKIYMEQEKQTFKRQAKERAEELARKNVDYFFTPRSEAQTTNVPYIPSPKSWKKISSLYNFPEENYYSALHKYREEPPAPTSSPKESREEPPAPTPPTPKEGDNTELSTFSSTGAAGENL